MSATQKALLNEDDLRAWLGYERTSDIEKKLREIGVRYRRAGKGDKIVTTLDAINKAIAGNDDFEDIQFGDPNGPQARNKG